MYDLVRWFCMPSAQAGFKTVSGTPYGVETHHLEGMNLTNNSKVYAYHRDTGQSMWFTKTKNGFPWDIKQYDQNFIYDTGTELDWSSPKDFKLMNPKVPMCVRFWDGNPTSYQFNQHATYDVYGNCKVVAHGDVGPVYYTLQGPFQMDFGGDVGVANTILLTYYWADKKNREQLFLTDRVGWCVWTHANLVQLSPSTADYVVDSYVVHNQIVSGQLVPQFPCFPIA